MHVCIQMCAQPPERGYIHAQAYSVAYMSESMLQDHTAGTVTCSVNMSEGVY